ncbi:MAG: Bug family tripartite tricarboxylate transporter substrate binding protein [Pseudomonadota bacterium]|uniref:Bug family tripartite tricarboxylate transporter substrate binding protein n=1 Tax=Roseovarius TaxID=74030 RepID=UPI0022A873D2|nr:tripartite tricarboxylate transporter substrate binding protein [Roseovarius sp. EGI FJ00037]MCZ0812154.1 tripartite tricarboxylate transporter substrate binding protein [Roseovarius sp. EGI FJ00037]
MTKTKILTGIAFATMTALPLAAQDYPSQPVQLTAPYGPGGASDLAARNLANVAPDYMGQPVLVTNRAGAGGATGSAYVKNSDPDGYNLLLARIGSHSISPALKTSMPYKWDDFTYLSLLEINPAACATATSKPYESLEELRAAIEAAPGAVTYSSAGVGTLHHLGGIMLLDELGFEDPAVAATHIPFQSGGAAAAAAATGQVDFVCSNISAIISQIEGGQLRPLVVTTPERVESLPDVQTASELGYPALEALVGWSGLVGPPGMSDEIVATWTEVLQEVASDERWVNQTKSLGSVPMMLSPEETVAFVENQYTTFRSLVEELGLQID